MSVIERQGDSFDIDSFRNSPNELHLTIKMAEALFLVPGAERPCRMDTNPPKKRQKKDDETQLRPTGKDQPALDKMGGGKVGQAQGWS